MQAVIIAAGKSTRTYPLTVSRPKPLLEVLDRPILAHTLDALGGLVDEAIIVVGFEKEQITERFGEWHKGIRLAYVEQQDQLGTGHALQAARRMLDDRFLLLNGDDLFARDDIAALLEHDCAMLVAEVPDVTRFGAVQIEHERVIGIVEKPAENISRYANTGAYVLQVDVLDEDLAKGERGEYEVTDYVAALVDQSRLKHELVGQYWIPVTYPWNYLEANVAMLRRLASSGIHKTAVVEEGVTMRGTVSIGRGSVIRSGTYIEGPVHIGADCEIGPHAYLRPDTILLDGVRTRGEIVDSVLMRGVTAKHSCYIGHSVIGERSNIAAGTITGDYRHDGSSNWSEIRGERVDSRRTKLGAFIGDDVRLGIGTLIYPGRKIWPGQTTLPGQVVDADIVG